MICMECKELVKPDWVSHEDENGNLVCLDCDSKYEVSEEMFGSASAGDDFANKLKNKLVEKSGVDPKWAKDHLIVIK